MEKTMPRAEHCVGLAKGPGDKPHQFTFISPDHADELPVGEYIYYSLGRGSDILQVVCRIEARVEARNYPDALLAHPEVSPIDMAALLGYSEPDNELFVITAGVLGHYDRSVGDFVNPRRLPRVGHPIYRAPAELLQAVLNRKKMDEPGGAHIGSLLSRPPDEVPIVLDAARFTSTHMAIIAGTGSGKSYLAAVIVEELLRPTNRASVLIIDPHGEYDSLAELSNLDQFQAPASDDMIEYRAAAKVLSPDKVKVAYRSLELDDLRYLLGRDLTAKQSYALGMAYRAAMRATRDKWTLTDLKNELANWAHRAANAPDEAGGGAADVDSNAQQTAAALSWRLDNVLGRSESRIFDDHLDLALSDLFAPGQCTVLQLSQVAEREQQVVVATILRRLYKARLATEQRLAAPGQPNYLPYPAFVILEEAHNFAPASADLVTSDQLKRILSEGRKFGVGVCLISQRPGRLDPDVLSQCMTQVLLRITNEVDQARVAQSVESVGRSLMDELPGLSKGQAIVAGMAVNTPVLVRVRSRFTRHQAQDPDAPARWRAHFDARQEGRRQRDEALPGRRPPPTTEELEAQIFGPEEDE